MREDPNYYDISQKYFLPHFQYSFDMPFFDPIHIPILKNLYYVYIYIDPIYSILYQYISSTGMLHKVLMYIHLYLHFHSQNLTDYLKYFYYRAWNIYFQLEVVFSDVMSYLPLHLRNPFSTDVLCQREFRDSAKCCACVEMVFMGTDISWD